MKHILYLQHVPWGWIKQRPHFLAEHLAGRYHVEVFAPAAFGTANLVRHGESSRAVVRSVPTLPLRRFKVIRTLNQILARAFFRSRARRSDFVWVTHPSLHAWVQGNLGPNTRLVYDCMDDALAFPAARQDAALRKALAQQERALTDRADMIFASSENLRTKLIARGVAPDKVHVVNNAIERRPEGAAQDEDMPERLRACLAWPGPSMAYCGTISDWFDFEKVMAALDHLPTLQCVLVGPSEVGLPCHPRLHHLGPVEHRWVLPLLRRFQILIMPFKLDDLIVSVDPVKLYEYIATGIPTVAVNYPETHKFEDFVHLYDTTEQFISILKSICHNENSLRPDPARIEAFLDGNSWSSRCEHLVRLLEPEA